MKKEKVLVEMDIDFDLKKKLLEIANKENISLDDLVNKLLRKKIRAEKKDKFKKSLLD